MSELYDFMKSFCGDDVTRPALCQPWRSAGGSLVYASNGYIAVRVSAKWDEVRDGFEEADPKDPSGSYVRAIESYFSPTSDLLKEGHVDEFRLSLGALDRWRRAALVAEDHARAAINAEPTSEFRDVDGFFDDSFTDWYRSAAFVEVYGNKFRSHAIRKICDAVEFSRRYCSIGAVPFPRIRVRTHKKSIIWCSLPNIDVVAMGVYGGDVYNCAVADADSGKLIKRIEG